MIMTEVDLETRQEAILRTANQVKSIRSLLNALDRDLVEALYFLAAEANGEPIHDLTVDLIRPILSTINAEDHLRPHRK